MLCPKTGRSLRKPHQAGVACLCLRIISKQARDRSKLASLFTRHIEALRVCVTVAGAGAPYRSTRAASEHVSKRAKAVSP